MRYGIFSDVHANLEAFEAVLESLSRERVDRYICGGDIVGYGADPSACIALTRRLNPIIVCGNHDWAACGLFDLEYFNETARDAVIWTRDVLSPAESEYLRGLKLTREEKTFILVHGSLDAPERFGYILNDREALASISRMDRPLSFVGHSHAAGTFFSDGGGLDYTAVSEIKIKEGRRYIVNAGSVGQPRDGDARAAYAVYDEDARRVEIKRVRYDIKTAQKKILKAGLPPTLAYRLENGT